MPEWKELPTNFTRAHHAGKTVFLVEFMSQQKASLVLKDLRTLDPQILLFLRRLPKLEIIDQSKKVISKDLLNVDGLCTISLNTTLNGKLVTAWGACQDWRYFHQKIPMSVEDAVRLGCTQTEVAIAFPVSSDPPRGQAFNILPICTTAFPFIVQGNFTLSASREGLDQAHQDWNDALLKGLSQVFTEAIKTFNNHEKLRYAWLRYLPTKEDLSQFSALSELIRVALKMSLVLFSAQPRLELPSKLCYVPEIWRDHHNEPLFRLSKTGLANLSTSYPTELLSSLEWLGIGIPDAKAILNGFRQYLKDDAGQEFQAQPVQWHSCLAEALLQYQAPQLNFLSIVPVEGGKWADARSQTIMFPHCRLSTGVVIDIPPGLPTLRVVRKEFADEDLQSLHDWYSKVGVNPGTLEETCLAIKEAHSGSDPPSDDSEILMLHALYLFNFWLEKGCPPTGSKTELWICNLDGFPLKSCVMYQDDSVVSEAARHYIKGTTSERNLMHPFYLAGIAADQRVQWSKWLSAHVGVLRDIRISDNIEGCFTPEFSICMRKNAPHGLLMVLSNTWRENFGSRDPNPNVRTSLKSMKKTWTSNDTEMELQETFLPRESVMERAPYGVPLLKVANPEDPSWDFLEQLGVIVEENVDLWLSSILHFMKGGASGGPMYRIYQSIYQYRSIAGQKIR